MAETASQAPASLKRPRIDDDVDERGLSGPGEIATVPVDMEESDDDDVGPMPLPAGADASVKPKRRKVLKHERLYLDRLPASDRYYRSFMHRDLLVDVTVTAWVLAQSRRDARRTAFILTTSIDGVLKFWKKNEPKDGEAGIEFVKQYRAHLGPILKTAVSADGLIAATISADETASQKGSVKVFDVEGFDMINMITLSYTPKTACWIHARGQALSLLAVAEEGSNVIRIYDGRGDGQALGQVEKVHRAPYNEAHDAVVSADESGMVEYWSPSEPYEHPNSRGIWHYKSQTDLYDFKKSKSVPSSLAFSPAGTHFVTTSLTTDRQVRVFSFLTGKLYRKYDESLAAIQEMQQAGTAAHKLEEMEFGRRLAQEKEIERLSDVAAKESAIFDESGAFLLYPTLLGVKVVNVVTNKVVHVLGKDETCRFLNVSLFQGTAAKQTVTTVAMAASDNPLLAARSREDPTLFCTAHKRQRFYLINRETESTAVERDIFNEKPTREEAQMASVASTKSSVKLPQSATIHTSMGDIHLRLFPEHAPKSVENFVTHARNGYYDKVFFHRVINKFMIQTGDPLGDGTGGESIWGGTFEDEFSSALKHDKPYTLSMANAGPKTNGSQFFVTTVPCPWLDNKHTIFGRAVAGLDVVHEIETTKVFKHTDRPENPVQIISALVSV